MTCYIQSITRQCHGVFNLSLAISLRPVAVMVSRGQLDGQSCPLETV